MATVSTPHSVNQSARRYRSAVKASNSRTGCSQRSSGTATKWLLAPTSMPAAFRFTWDKCPVRRCRPPTFPAGFAPLSGVLIIPSAMAAWACRRRESPTAYNLSNGSAPRGVTNDAAFRTPRPCYRPGITHQCQSGLCPDDRPQRKLTPAATPVQLVASARPGHGHRDAPD